LAAALSARGLAASGGRPAPACQRRSQRSAIGAVYDDAVLVVVLVALASYRITRLLVRDEFPPISVRRARIAERWGDESWQAYLSTCSWCAGVYVAGLVTLATWAATGLPVPALVWASAAAVTGFLASKEGG
jgi:hypothetical protein